MIDLEELERLERAATPGPWLVRGIRMLDFGPGVEFEPTTDLDEAVHANIREYDDTANVAEHIEDIPSAELIAAARNALPELLRELKAARECVELLRSHYEVTEEVHDEVTGQGLKAYDEAAK